jgi:hypothetical protein
MNRYSAIFGIIINIANGVGFEPALNEVSKIISSYFQDQS